MPNTIAVLRSNAARIQTIATVATARLGGVAPNLPTFTAALVSGQIVLTFSRAILDTALLRTAANYTITPPAGSPVPSVTAFIVGSSLVTLTLDSETVNGGSYSVALAQNTARAADTGEGNAAGSASFTGSSTAPTVLSAAPQSQTTVKVTFSKAVRQVSAANSDDALKPANYSIPGLTPVSVATINSSAVLLTHTPAETAGQSYTLTASNIKDLAGNAI